MWPARWVACCADTRGWPHAFSPMTNRPAFFLIGALLAVLGAELALTGGSGALFPLRKLAHLIEWLAFWR